MIDLMGLIGLIGRMSAGAGEERGGVGSGDARAGAGLPAEKMGDVGVVAGAGVVRHGPAVSWVSTPLRSSPKTRRHSLSCSSLSCLRTINVNIYGAEILHCKHTRALVISGP